MADFFTHGHFIVVFINKTRQNILLMEEINTQKGHFIVVKLDIL
jgi:hypothetical protein